jgi:hypothetical protein
MDHPLSFHHQTLNNNLPNYKVSFPSLQTEKQLASAKLVQNGFYSKEPLSLSGAYKPSGTLYGKRHHELVTPLD